MDGFPGNWITNETGSCFACCDCKPACASQGLGTFTGDRGGLACNSESATGQAAF